MATKIGNKILVNPAMLPPIPTPTESKDRANPKYKASLQSILLEPSKSEQMGSRIICMVIPNDFIKKLYIFLDDCTHTCFLDFSFILWYIIHNPKNIKTAIPINDA